MHTREAESASDQSLPSLTTWRWISRWPAPAQYALVTAMFLSGSQLMGSYRWIQGVMCLVWIGWLLLEVLFDRESQRLHRLSWWRFALIVAIGVSGLTYILYDLVTLVW